MALDKQILSKALADVELPTGHNLGAPEVLTKCAVHDGAVAIAFNLAELSEAQRARVRAMAEQVIYAAAASAGGSVKQITIEFTGQAPASAPPKVVPLAQASVKPPMQNAGASRPSGSGDIQANAPKMAGVKHIIAVGAGKGGVGKSTISVNIAVGLALRGHAVGILDADIYGPSLPTMMGLTGLQTNVVGGMIQPFLVHGVKATTIGKLVDPEKPLIWRGPMAHGAFKQLVEQTEWGELDYLIIDLPPGTGDVALSMAQLLRLSGAVVVCTPQQVAQDDAIRALRMFQQLGIEVLGVVENMSYFIGDDAKEYDIFGRGGAQMMAQRTGVPFLGAVPINMALRKNSDDGNPSANWQGSTKLSHELDRLVTNVENQVALAGIRSGNQKPTLTIS
jgi:ATP-binding protein involved in chromosome partitioning